MQKSNGNRKARVAAKAARDAQGAGASIGGEMAEAATVLDTLNPLDEPHVFHAHNGLVFQLKLFARWIIVDIIRKYGEKMPKVPLKYNTEKGRDEPNPDDADYKQVLQDVNMEMGSRVTRAYMKYGCAVREPLPEDIEHWSGTDWSDNLAEDGIVVASEGRQRYYDWLIYYAVVGDDMERLTAAISAYNGTPTVATVPSVNGTNS